ncbi:hypothetical protein DWX58_05070 [Pseudoflavonifractor sp. AF19-9AC]|uniref:ATP-binding protein n=1 Tax=Pseudoflavonifractor sp. AF19-9AC TaxID=2292244 RepID=UPI000E4B4BF4|nr:AAA family ATPase [Pseudoflavonifractor sp. AF19-9AC]RHR10755.1 hypothetical protein DWX58_05070 [Pseudoflavonifractor sp. AF19-9AC]
MRIKSMTATFGKLEKARLELGEGLNLIEAPNEGGKSTWCAFWRAMLYGIDTRDRDKKGHLADKNRYQPWSGAPMEGEVELEWQGRAVTLRRGPRGNTPFGSFSAVYTGTEEPVPGLTAQTCGELLTGVGREVFERSAFIGSGGNLTVTAAPELEKRIAALVSSGEEDVSYSQTEGRLKEWLNRRRVNKSVGLIPRLTQELEEVEEALAQVEETAGQIASLEARRAALEEALGQLEGERAIHQRLARRDLDRRCAQAGEELRKAQEQLDALTAEQAKYGPIPDAEHLKKAQGELQYLKVLDDEIRQGTDALKEAEEAYVQAQIAAQDEHFQGLSAEEAVQQVQRQLHSAQQSRDKARRWKVTGGALLAGAVLLVVLYQLLFSGAYPSWVAFLGPCAVLLFLSGLFCLFRGRKTAVSEETVCARYHVQSREQLDQLLRDYAQRCQAAQIAAQHSKEIRGTLNDRKARRDNSWADITAFVRTFAPEVQNEFGVSAALSRALNLGHELAMAKDRVEERRRRREDLLAQGGKDFDTLEAIVPPERSPEQTLRALEEVSGRLEQVRQALNQALGRQKAVGDPAALAARKEELQEALRRREEEYDALTLAMDALKRANTHLQERFSPELNRLAGQYLSRLTGQRYASVTLNRELEGAAARAGDVLPRSALYLSRGTADQLYLAVRLAVCRLCLPEKPPLVLDDALAAFDDERLGLALELLEELAGEQQVLLFTCQSREGALLAGRPGVTRLALPV